MISHDVFSHIQLSTCLHIRAVDQRWKYGYHVQFQYTPDCLAFWSVEFCVGSQIGVAASSSLTFLLYLSLKTTSLERSPLYLLPADCHSDILP